MLHFLGITANNKVFSIGCCFIPQEKEPDYTFAMEAFKELVMVDLADLVVALTDDEVVFKNAIEAVLPNTKQLLCVWHVNKNVLGKVQKIWSNKDIDGDNEEGVKECDERREAVYVSLV